MSSVGSVNVDIQNYNMLENDNLQVFGVTETGGCDEPQAAVWAAQHQNARQATEQHYAARNKNWAALKSNVWAKGLRAQKAGSEAFSE